MAQVHSSTNTSKIMANSQNQRVVVTGLGVVAPVGNTLNAYWDALLAGQNGIGRIRGLIPMST